MSAVLFQKHVFKTPTMFSKTTTRTTHDHHAVLPRKLTAEFDNASTSNAETVKNVPAVSNARDKQPVQLQKAVPSVPSVTPSMTSSVGTNQMDDDMVFSSDDDEEMMRQADIFIASNSQPSQLSSQPNQSSTSTAQKLSQLSVTSVQPATGKQAVCTVQPSVSTNKQSQGHAQKNVCLGHPNNTVQKTLQKPVQIPVQKLAQKLTQKTAPKPVENKENQSDEFDEFDDFDDEMIDKIVSQYNTRSKGLYVFVL